MSPVRRRPKTTRPRVLRTSFTITLEIPSIFAEGTPSGEAFRWACEGWVARMIKGMRREIAITPTINGFDHPTEMRVRITPPTPLQFVPDPQA